MTDIPLHIDNPDIRRDIQATTFKEAQALQKGFSQRFVIGAINADLIGPDGKKVIFIKSYLDMVMPDQEEQQASKSPAILANLHSEAAQMIIDNLKIWGSLTDAQKKYVKFYKDEYFERLQRSSGETKQILEQVAAGQNPKNYETAMALRGLFIKDKNGRMVDISTFGGDTFANMRPNIRLQAEWSEQFIHWETDAFSQAKLRGQKPDLDKRIYLNPKTSALIKTFTSLMQSFNEAGIPVKGKVLDRAYGFSTQIRSSETKPIRADGIVLVIPEADADKVLDMVLSFYRENPNIFTNRSTPKVPLRIAPGIALGDESKKVGSSLTAHRADVIGEAAELTRKRMGLGENKVTKEKEQRAFEIFSTVFTEVAKANGVDPRNLAFNLPKS